jgi:hypothetical protein
MVNWKGCGRKQSWSNFNVLSQHLTKGLMNTTKNISEYSLCPGRDLNPGPPEYGAGVLATQARRSIEGCHLLVAMTI